MIGGGAVVGFGAGATGFASVVFGGANNGGRIGAGVLVDNGAVTMDFGITVGVAGVVGTDGGARRAVGFGVASTAAGGFGGAIGVSAAERRTATVGAGCAGGTDLATGGGKRLIGRGGGATLAAAGGPICRVAVPPGILPAGKLNFE